MLIGCFFGALNALGISILGEYVVRIYDQVRGRPLYLVDRCVNFATPEEDGLHHNLLAELTDMLHAVRSASDGDSAQRSSRREQAGWSAGDSSLNPPARW